MKRNGGGISVNKMRKKMIKPIALVLSTVMLASSLVGCGSGNESTIEVPKNTLMKDEYEPNQNITDNLSYQMDYVTMIQDPNYLEVVRLFDHMKVTVDDWPYFTIGVSTLGDVVTTVEQMNKTYVETKTQAVIDERQAEIDKEYEKAKKKAEARGKEYTKKKKEVRTDDIHFDEPYSYMIKLGDENSHPNGLFEEYKPTLLVDPLTYPALQLEIYKYGIPYVLVCAEQNYNYYNDGICQESDWIVTKMEAANVAEYTKTDEQGAIVDLADFVDADSRNKAAKKNMKMSGNIRFDGDGFNWDSLLKLCEALNLEKQGRNYAFVQSSDEKFTYYTIDFITNPYETKRANLEDSDTVYPAVKLVATFDPLTQVCLNWTIQNYVSDLSYYQRKHELSDAFNVNVQNFQVDTNDYEGMRKTIKEWIEKHAVNLTSAYCAIDEENEKTPLVGVVDTGLTNVTIEPVIDGVTYACQDYTLRENGEVYGTFISHENLTLADTMEEGDRIKHLEKNTHKWVIKCCMLDAERNIIGQVEDNVEELVNCDQAYYVVDYEKTDAGYKNVKVIEEENVQQLLNLYTKTYQLNNEEATELQDIYRDKGVRAVKEHIDEMFREAEEAKKEYDKQNGIVSENNNENIVLPDKEYYKTEQNIDLLSTTLNYGDVAIDINEITPDKVKSLGFSQGSKQSGYNSELISMSFKGHMHTIGDTLFVSTTTDNKVDAILFDSEAFSYEGITVGATREDIKNALSFAHEIPTSGDVLLKSDKNAVLFVFNESDVVGKVILFTNNEIGFHAKQNQETEEGVVDTETEDKKEQYEQLKQEFLTALPTEEPEFYTMDVNTELDLSIFMIDDKEFNVNMMKEEEIVDYEYVKSGIHCVSKPGSPMFFAGMIHNKDANLLSIDKTEDKVRSVMLMAANMSSCNVKVGMTKEETFAALQIDETFLKETSEPGVECVSMKNETNGLIVYFKDNTVQQIQLIADNYMSFDANANEQVVNALVSEIESLEQNNTQKDEVDTEQNKESEESNKEEDKKEEKEEQSTDSGNAIVLLVSALLSLIVVILLIIAYCKIFVKMEEPAWKAFVPGLNLWVLASKTWASPVLGMIGMLVPGLNFVFVSITTFKLYRAFDKNVLFSILGTFTPAAPICLLILAFGDAEYEE